MVYSAVQTQKTCGFLSSRALPCRKVQENLLLCKHNADFSVPFCTAHCHRVHYTTILTSLPMLVFETMICFSIFSDSSGTWDMIPISLSFSTRVISV